MRNFSKELERSKEIRRELSARFDLADEFFDYWMQLSLDELAENRLPDSVINVGLILNVQVCRFYRSVVQDCLRCEASTAAIVGRSLFETALAMMFVLKTDVFLKAEVGRKQKHPFVPVASADPADRLPEEVRAAMYMMHPILDEDRFVREHVNAAGITEPIPPEVDAYLQAQRDLIGPKWMSILETTKHYSGFNIKDTAKLVGGGMHQWQQTIYSMQSRLVHSVDPMAHMDLDLDGHPQVRYLSSSEDVDKVLMAGTQTFRICVSTLEEFVGFGPAVKARVEEFSKRCDALDNESAVPA